MAEFFGLFDISLLSALLRMSVTYMLAGLAYSICAQCGIIELSLEGKMLGGAFIAVWISYATGSAWMGTLAAMLLMGLLSLLAALPIVFMMANQVVIGTGLDFIMQGLTTVGISIVWGLDGASPQVAQLSSSVSNFLGSLGGRNTKLLFGMQTPILYIAIVLLVAAYIVMYNTKKGLRLRAIGENTSAADTLGINVHAYQWGALIISGMLCGLAGADLSIGRLDYFNRDMLAGRGWIALSVSVLGRYNPLLVMLASLLVGMVEALQIRLQSVFSIPPQLFQIIPYVVPVLILAGFGGMKNPSWLGKPYRRSERE